MMGRGTKDSTQMKRGKQIPKMESDVMTRGCVHGKTLPPRFWGVCLMGSDQRVGMDLRSRGLGR